MSKLALVLFGVLAGCGGPPAAPSGRTIVSEQPTATATGVEEAAAYDRARPVFEVYCASCHKRGAARASEATLEHFDMTTYPFGGHHAAEIGAAVRDALGVGGKKPTMPMDRPGVVVGDELAAIVAWSEAFDAARGKGDGQGGHEHAHH